MKHSLDIVQNLVRVEVPCKAFPFVLFSWSKFSAIVITGWTSKLIDVLASRPTKFQAEGTKKGANYTQLITAVTRFLTQTWLGCHSINILFPTLFSFRLQTARRNLPILPLFFLTSSLSSPIFFTLFFLGISKKTTAVKNSWHPQLNIT